MNGSWIVALTVVVVVAEGCGQEPQARLPIVDHGTITNADASSESQGKGGSAGNGSAGAGTVGLDAGGAAMSTDGGVGHVDQSNDARVATDFHDAGAVGSQPDARPGANNDAAVVPLADAAPMPKRDAGLTVDVALPAPDTAPPAPPAPIMTMVAASDDTYAQGSGVATDGTTVDNSNTNFGTEMLLLIKYRSGPDEQYYWREAFVKFPLSFANVVKATLVLNAETSDAASSDTLDVNTVTSAWTETGLTWSNKPAADMLIGQVTVPPAGMKAALSLDVTDYVTSQKKGGATDVAFSLKQDQTTAYDNTARIEVDARELGATGPQLLLETLP